MTNKQIIIHGVDISKCEYHSKLLEGVCTFYGRCANTFCPYKVKWLKEQLEGLKEHHHKTECEASENLKKLVKLEQECEELKEQLEIAKQNYSYEAEKLESYIQTLTEIKEIAEKGDKEKGNLMRTWWFKDILQKISEVEDD